MSACNAGDLGSEDPLEKEKATHSSILAWRIPWTDCIVHGVAKSQMRLPLFLLFNKYIVRRIVSVD